MSDDGKVSIVLTKDEALALYFWTQVGDNCPDYWTCPLKPVGSALALWYREGGDLYWSSDQEETDDDARTDDVRGWLHEMSESDPDHGQAAMASRALGVIHDRGDEIDRLRAAGDELAESARETLDEDDSLSRRRLDNAEAWWRTARGDAPREG